ncbi:CCA tRNA nucleotidyltransferase [Paenibacillus sp. GCM10012307]|uniref:CCA tRNA nucleotidyltransferase n=1 Tax=Paenibacillus roseus TaxID=2798579 RepID=A0A934MS51_9BACL|nr:CCA tRNA nucleotidyltransferase [Paenibacillus roseus]
MSNKPEPEVLGHPLFRSALPVIQKLTVHHYEAVFVGGCVRDALAGRDIADIDIATAATPEQVLELFDHVAPTGLQHGTVTVIMGGKGYEVTTFRKESAYEAFRKPSSVEFISDLNEDLRRRDFTVNAMAMSEDGKLIDPFGGQADLRRGLIRCVGDADARLQEDALRMLRGLRFAADYGFGQEGIEPSTWAAILRHGSLLRHIAMERVGVELHKMIKGPHPDWAVQLLLESRLLENTKEKLPLTAGNIPVAWMGPSQGEQPSEVLLEPIDSASCRWAALCISFGLNPETSRSLFQALRYSRQQSDEIVSIIALHRRTVNLVVSQSHLEGDLLAENWTRITLEMGKEASQFWLEMIEQAPWLLEGDETRSLVVLLRRLWSELPVRELQQLAVNGGDILSDVRVKGGPWLKNLLFELLLDVALGRLPNEKKALLQQVRRKLEKEQS